ncbi:MAG TPA: hypothetical protein EYH44_05925 [Thermoprotei archaeon]|nr:hypothetical protein [Thermoprotei archaeon]
MERIISSSISLFILILTLSIVLPSLITYSTPSPENGLSECVKLVGDAAMNGWLITLSSISPDGATLVINETIKVDIYVVDGEFKCIEVASHT